MSKPEIHILFTPITLSIRTLSFFRGCRGLQASPPRGTNFKISKNRGFTSPYTLPLEPFRYGFRCSRFFHEDQGFRRLFFKKFLQRAPTIGRGKFLDPEGAEGKKSTGSLVGKIRVSSFVSEKGRWQRGDVYPTLKSDNSPRSRQDARSPRHRSTKKFRSPEQSEGCSAATWRIVRFAMPRKSYDLVASKAPTKEEPRGKKPCVKAEDFFAAGFFFKERGTQPDTCPAPPPHGRVPLSMPDDRNHKKRGSRKTPDIPTAGTDEPRDATPTKKEPAASGCGLPMLTREGKKNRD